MIIMWMFWCLMVQHGRAMPRTAMAGMKVDPSLSTITYTHTLALLHHLSFKIVEKKYLNL